MSVHAPSAVTLKAPTPSPPFEPVAPGTSVTSSPLATSSDHIQSSNDVAARADAEARQPNGLDAPRSCGASTLTFGRRVLTAPVKILHEVAYSTSSGSIVGALKGAHLAQKVIPVGRGPDASFSAALCAIPFVAVLGATGAVGGFAVGALVGVGVGLGQGVKAVYRDAPQEVSPFGNRVDLD